ncbi:helix-turn-helix transcriptional regulator [Amycolatopsis minnesotensis]|uniref:Helix-turn-helix transcriptional regulator n=1 Tax=Amycolatopsis minnesotensis TaxID=337894 RepID=A0ABP5DSA3_9PSEU
MKDTGQQDSSVRARELGHALKLARQRANLTGRALSQKLSWPHGKLSFIENGRRPITEAEVAAWLASCGPLIPEEYERLRSMAKEPDTGYRACPHDPELPARFRSLLVQENAAREVTAYEPLVVPGPLQTEDYVRALVGWSTPLPPSQQEARVLAGLQRQEMLHARGGPDRTFFVQESALRMKLGDARTMYEQILFLVLASSEGLCPVRVVPNSAGPFRALGGGFRLMDFDECPTVAYTEGSSAGVFLERPADIVRYRGYFSRLENAALNREESRAWLLDLASSYERAANGH